MAVDKVKPLKIENATTGGTQTDPYPTEANPTQDYLATKGIAFEGLDTFLIDKIGRTQVELFPDTWQRVNYTGAQPTSLEFFNNSSFVNANRIARYDFTYTGPLLTTEVLVIYDTNGTTVLRTYTWTHTYSSNIFQSSRLVIT